VAALTFLRRLFLHDAHLVLRDIRRSSPIMKNRNTSKFTLWFAVVALALTMVASLNFSTSVSADGGSDLGTSPFDFSDATYRANVRTIETTPGTTGSSGLTYANIFGVLNSNSFEHDAAGNLTARAQSSFDTAEHFRVFIFPKASNGSILDPFLP